MKRDDFVFTIGYQGETAIVDSRAAGQYKGLGAIELAEKGLFRAAFCSALYENDQDSQQAVLDRYNKASGATLKSPEEMKRLLGVFSVPENINRITKI